MSDDLPRAVRPFLNFVTLLRANDFMIAPEQTTAFLSAISLLGPRDPEDIRRSQSGRDRRSNRNARRPGADQIRQRWL